MNILKKWLPVIVIFIISLIFIITSNSNLPKFNIKDEEVIPKSKIDEIIKLLDNDETKKTAMSSLDELYKDHKKDDNYYIANAKITLETNNDIEAISPLNYVKNKTIEYYKLRIRASAGEYFTMGNVPNGLLETTLEAAQKYSDTIDFQILAGELFYDKDNYTAALYYLDKALQIDENNIEANYYYSLCLYLLGDKEEGINYMSKTLNSYKGNDNEFKKSMENYINIMKEGKR